MPDWILQTFTVAGPLITATALWLLNHFHEANKNRLDGIKDKLDHVDECLDELKQRVARLEGTDDRARYQTMRGWLQRDRKD